MRMIDADATLETIIGLTELVIGEGAALAKALIFAALKSESIIPTVGGWISVKDRLPEIGKLALVYGSCGAMTVARHVAGNEWVVPGIFSSVTHWMPLPEPPKEDKT